MQMSSLPHASSFHSLHVQGSTKNVPVAHTCNLLCILMPCTQESAGRVPLSMHTAPCLSGSDDVLACWYQHERKRVMGDFSKT